LNHQTQESSIILNLGIGLGLFLLTQLIYSFNLNHDVYVDELYHLLAAHSAHVDGTLGLADGQYVRTEYYTRFIGFLFGVFGESTNVARVSSSIITGLFIVAVFYSLRRMIGMKEALLSVAVLTVLPSTIYLAQFIRFYAIHELAFWLGAIGVFTIFTTRLSLIPLLVITACTGVLLWLAHYLQVISLIGLVALLFWVFLYLIYQWVFVSKREWLETSLLMMSLLLGVLIAVFIVYTGKASVLWSDFRYAAPWSAENKDNILFYSRYFRHHYPTFWTLFPIACLVALYYKPKPAFFFIWIFCFSIVIFSLGGMKDERYIIHLLPFAVAIWSICFVALLPKLLTLISDALGVVPWFKSNNIMAYLFVAGISGFVVINNQAFPTSFHLLNGQQYRHEIGNWSLSKEIVEPLVEKADVVLTTNELESQYYFNRFDFNFSRNRLLESGGIKVKALPEEFSTDERTGRPVISSMDSLNLVFNCYRKGVFLGDSRKWYKDGKALGPKGVELLERSATRIAVNPDSRLVVFTWQKDELYSEEACSKLYLFTPPVKH
jgi:hypothetical protein